MQTDMGLVPSKSDNSARRGLLQDLLRSTSASVLPMMAAAMIPTMAMIGAGVDFGRAYLANSKLQGAADAGALATVRAKQLSANSESRAQEIGEDYIYANFPDNYLNANLQTPDVDVRDEDDVISATVTVSGSINTTLLRLVGIDTLPISARAVAEASEELPTAVEALLVLDNTGSMQSGGRMDSLKTAAKNFVNVIYGDDETRENFAVGILPYNTMVNVGHLVAAANPNLVQSRPGFTNVSLSDPLSWKGCLFADQTIRNISDDRFMMDPGAYDIGADMPGENGMPRFEPFVYPPIYVNSFQDINNRYEIPNSRQDDFFSIPTVRDALIRLHGNNICKNRSNGQPRNCDQNNTVIDFDRLPDRGNYRSPRFYSHKSGNGTNASPNNLWGASPNYQCPAEALPLSYESTKSQLRGYIDNENHALLPGTGTFHNAAMTWAYRLVQRDDVFTRNRPTNVPTKKIVIFMTDGNFDSRDDGRNTSSGRVLDTAYTAYKTYEDRTIISGTSRNQTIDHLGRRFAKTCEAMKADGIEIYTIAFALNNNAAGDATREMFRTCATDRNTHFFSAANGADLNNAFVTIASELIDLRLSQ
ncbi:Flp pilus assembly protein TadG [Erythrobacter litoralis]|nr:TadE/TadG family type IV pilus assembly protein [Erythrobacter litoralis]AOL23494.1 Flp pilus assembly protein TadG [Erythrobacter litoralis]